MTLLQITLRLELVTVISAVLPSIADSHLKTEVRGEERLRTGPERRIPPGYHI